MSIRHHNDPPERSAEEQAETNASTTRSALRRQAKVRRENGKERQLLRTWDQLPLFADERSLSDAVMGPGRYTQWRAVVPLLERRGFPAIDALMGGRYVPAVKAFFDREYRVGMDGPPARAPHQPAALGAAHRPAEFGQWKKRPKSTGA